jgi:hypothetical protein
MLVINVLRGIPEQMTGHHFTQSVWKILVGLKQENQTYYFDKSLDKYQMLG